MDARHVLAVVVVGLFIVGSGSTVFSQTMEFGKEAAEETMGEEEKKEKEKQKSEQEKQEQKRRAREKEKKQTETQKKKKKKEKQAPAKPPASAKAPLKDVSKKARQFINEGKSLYQKKKYDQASLIFFRILKQEGVDSKPAIPVARYNLAKTLFKMELYQGAVSHFGKIVQAGRSHPYYVPTLSGLLTLSEVIPADPELRKHLAQYADLFPSQVPRKHRDRYAYLTGRYFYSKLKVPQASRMFKAISKRSQYYAKARYILGTTHVANYSAQPAVAAFKSVLRYLKPKQKEGELTDDQKKLLELTNLAMARVFYSTGDYKTSLKYYDKVGRDSPRWPQALFEESWAYFQLNRFNKALGNLHSLNSPFFKESYFPEGPILAAVIYFYNCKYDRVRNQLEEFEYVYEPLKKEMDAVLEANQGGSAMYKWYNKLQNGNVEFEEDVRRVIEAALEDKQVQTKFKLVGDIDKEIEKIKSMPSSWKTSKLGQSLIKGANLAKNFARQEAGSLARQRLKRRARKLNDLINQKKKVKFEIARAKKGNLAAEIPSGQEIEANQRKPGEVDVSDKKMYWKFKGEYWRDELGHYVFNIGSECQR